MLFRSVSQSRYKDWVETVYTSSWNMHTETPTFEGGTSQEIVFQEVVSNSATEDEPLGTLAGRGINVGKQKGGKNLRIPEGQTWWIRSVQSTAQQAANLMWNFEAKLFKKQYGYFCGRYVIHHDTRVHCVLRSSEVDLETRC